jgi:hypothetical protein
VSPDGNNPSPQKLAAPVLTPDVESIVPVSTLAFGTGHNSSDALDYFHINSVDRDADHNYLVSGRHASTIYKINGTSGAILWRLGGRNSSFSLGPGVAFSLQHHARYVSRSQEANVEVITLFDNSGSQPKDGENGIQSDESSGKLVSINTKTWTATLLQSFPAPDSIIAYSQGNTQILPNENVFVNWGSGGAVTEFSSNGTAIFHAYLESGELWENGAVQNYRGFKFNWTGIPNEEPAVVALKHGESIVVNVSWNGDTETVAWRFYGIPQKVGGQRNVKGVLLGQERRDGFETSFYVKSGSGVGKIFAEAVGKNGKALQRTRVVQTEEYIYEYVPGRDDFALDDEKQIMFMNSGGYT